MQLSKGPDVVAFPDLTGQTYAQAQVTLAGAGFAINSLLGTTEGTFVSASINGDPVEPGAAVPPQQGPSTWSSLTHRTSTRNRLSGALIATVRICLMSSTPSSGSA